MKNIDDAANWVIWTVKDFNPNNFVLSANVADGGQTYDAYSGAYYVDFTSNGFKVRATNVTNSNVVTLTSTQHGQKHHQLTCMVVALTQGN